MNTASRSSASHPSVSCRASYRASYLALYRALYRAAAILITGLLGVFAASNVSAQGLLLPTDTSLGPLTLASHTVSFEIQDHGAVTHVTQEFDNPTGQMLEATYYFPMPEGAVTTDFALWMNGERISGEVLPRDQARATYEGIVARMRDPGLLEYVDGTLFQARIFPIPANGRQRVEIEFASTLQQTGSTLHYRYPLHDSAGTMGQFVIDGTLRSGNQIANVYSPYHDVETLPQRDGSVRVSMEQMRATAESDFELFINLTGEDLGFSLVTWEPGGGDDGYFMLTLAASPELRELEVLPKQVTFVVDTSGSMSGVKIRQAREMLEHCVRNLNPQDTFQLIGFSGGVRAAFDEPMMATRQNVNAGLEFIEQLSARGNTNISDALARALQDPSAPDRPHAIIFVTDGLPTAGDTSVEGILSSATQGISDGDRRIFSFGVGYDVNTRLLDGMARDGRGESGYVRPNEDISDIIGSFYDRVGSPVLTQLEFDFGRVDVSQVYPSPMPDLYREREVTLFGRYNANQTSAVVVRGNAGDRSWVEEFGASFAPPEGTDTAFIGNLWASRRVASLLNEIDVRGERRDLVDEVTRLAQQWGIVTPYTSYLAVEPTMQQQPLVTDNTGFFDDGELIHEGGLGRQTGTTASGRSAGSRSAGGFGGADPSAAAADQEEMDVHNLHARSTPPTPEATRRDRALASATRDESGQEAVERSIARREQAQQSQVRDTRTRNIAGRSFASASGVWVESGLENETPDRTITAMSGQYFTLLRDNPELADVLSLGERVRFRLGREVIEIRP
ncbi:MAG: Ca-activated chloride channel family protein [Flavobacteriales bacterium]|jgi:Ca-activated chloride channel family protein